MRRLAALFLAAVSLPACAGEHGERAQELLARAQAAQARLTSASYEARMTFTMDGRKMSLVMDGGGYLKGRRAGDTLLRMRTDGVPQLGAVNMEVLVRQGRASMTMNGRRFSLPVPASGTAAPRYDWSSTMVDLTRYVKQVKVREGRVVNGERGATIAGVLDTSALVEAASKLGGLGQAANLDELAGKLGDIHAAVFMGERTGLVRSAVLTMSMEADGKKADVELSYRLRATNTAIAGL
jgi:hypothetical protein